MSIELPQVSIKRRQPIRTGTMWLPMMVIVIGGTSAIAFSIRFAKNHLQRTELRTAAEAAANAAAATFASTGDRQQAILRAQELAAANRVGGKPLALKDENIRFVAQPATDDQTDQVVVAIRIHGDAEPQTVSSLLTLGFDRPGNFVNAEATATFHSQPSQPAPQLPEAVDDVN